MKVQTMEQISPPGAFQGWEAPQSNFFQLPNSFTDQVSLMESEAEIKVVLYVLRHTWGYQEFDEGKKITLDEFQNGRKRRDGTRIDKGTGLSKPAITRGIKAAVGHGFLLMEEDRRDLARVKRFFRLRMKGDSVHPYSKRDVTSAVTSRLLCSNGTLHRTEKQTVETNCRKSASPADGDLSFDLDGEKKREPDEADNLAETLYLGLHRNNLTSRRPNVKVTWAIAIRKFLRDSIVTSKDFAATLDWYVDHVKDEFTPQAFDAKAFIEKYISIVAAMHRADDYTPPVSYAQPEEVQIGTVRSGELTDEEYRKLLQEADEC